MITLISSFLFSALRNLFDKQPDLSEFTSETNEHEPNLSFNLANELWPYMFWLHCDFDIIKPHPERRRPDLVFHRRGINALNFLVVEVKRRKNPDGVQDDIDKILGLLFRGRLEYRFGASVLIDEEAEQFEVQLFENFGEDAPTQTTFDEGNKELFRPSMLVKAEHRAELADLVGQIAAAERTGHDPATVKARLDQLVSGLYK